MSAPTLCPACLTELPEDYPFDHVRIDRVLAGDITLLHGMNPDERREVVAWARQRGLSSNALAEHLHRSTAEIDRWMTYQKPDPTSKFAAFDHQVRALWEQNLSDLAIAQRLHRSRKTIIRSRNRQQLAAVVGPFGMIRKAAA